MQDTYIYIYKIILSSLFCPDFDRIIEGNRSHVDTHIFLCIYIYMHRYRAHKSDVRGRNTWWDDPHLRGNRTGLEKVASGIDSSESFQLACSRARQRYSRRSRHRLRLYTPEVKLTLVRDTIGSRRAWSIADEMMVVSTQPSYDVASEDDDSAWSPCMALRVGVTRPVVQPWSYMVPSRTRIEDPWVRRGKSLRQPHATIQNRKSSHVGFCT
jgi:hypothetical protein